jgi:hypothetical protein
VNWYDEFCFFVISLLGVIVQDTLVQQVSFCSPGLSYFRIGGCEVRYDLLHFGVAHLFFSEGCGFINGDVDVNSANGASGLRVDGPNYGESFPFGCGIIPFWSGE